MNISVKCRPCLTVAMMLDILKDLPPEMLIIIADECEPKEIMRVETVDMFSPANPSIALVLFSDT